MLRFAAGAGGLRRSASRPEGGWRSARPLPPRAPVSRGSEPPQDPIPPDRPGYIPGPQNHHAPGRRDPDRNRSTPAKDNNVAVVPVTETLPAGNDYLSWMDANITAIATAVGG
jgi:hypothetical protein